MAAAAGGAAPHPESPRRGPAADGEEETAEVELAAELAARRSAEARRLVLSPRRLSGPLPAGLSQWFPALEVLDVSGTGLAELGEELLALPRLHTLLAKNNRLGGPGSLPKRLGQAPLGRSLRVLNFSGNRFAEVPPALLELRGLQSLSLGGNRLHGIPPDIQELRSLEFLYLGGNFITSIPPELANLPSLSYLVLCDNKIQSIPPQLAQLHSLRSLSLHNNLLTYLPREILNLVHLEELSLRGNPLVVRFVRDLTYNPPSLQELAGRTIKTRNVPYAPSDLPENLVRYLSLASNCPNPKCGGVYFDSCVRQIKFVDFCGKYRLPLMHYLCSPECSSPCSSASQSSTSQSESDSEDEASVAARRMQKVLLG
ncbi:leucine-rich repeat-containing protein 58 [Pezoporus wallicus]|uniref:leucine-rich repeat-containing protein 58 n=1 Tax=Pezoporus wallicus TaxID=35540 RepID=UPI00254B668B|nr:leucine-rich repeat-containing protein 58 [Pezoporus wallicus]XP_061310249.1 leucine-rich repeat-containing protein 58 [Pezoporus flaviventris]